MATASATPLPTKIVLLLTGLFLLRVIGQAVVHAGIVWFSFVYAGAMAVRYIARMSRRPEQRWFGGAIPIVFHRVLAAYLFVLGSFHAAG